MAPGQKGGKDGDDVENKLQCPGAQLSGTYCPWIIFCHVEKFEMWRQFLCGEISDV